MIVTVKRDPITAINRDLNGKQPDLKTRFEVREAISGGDGEDFHPPHVYRRAQLISSNIVTSLKTSSLPREALAISHLVC